MTRKIILLMVVLALLASSQLSATEISGALSGTLTRANSPYQVVGNISVIAFSALVIEPGVVLDFRGNYQFSIYVSADLQAIGTPTDSIYFTCDTIAFPSRWKGIAFFGPSNSTLQYCRIEFANSGGVIFDGAANFISHNTIIHNNCSGSNSMKGGGIQCVSGASPLINDNLITENEGLRGGGIYISGAGASLGSNIISHNHATEYGGGIYCHSGTDYGLSSQGNIVTMNSASYGGGIAAINSGITVIQGQITNNTADFAGGGVYLDSAGAIISRDSIAGNSAQSNGAGIFATHFIGRNTLVRGNFIIGNIAGANGGAIYSESNPLNTVEGNMIDHNSAGIDGGAICILSSDLLVSTLVDNVITSNAAMSGGGLYLDSVQANCQRNLIALNTADEAAAINARQGTTLSSLNDVISHNDPSVASAVMVSEGSSLIMTGGIIWNNAPMQLSGTFSPSYSDIERGFDGDGNIDTDPLFRNPDSGNFLLMSTSCGDPFDSPCIDAGSPDYADHSLSCATGLGTALCDMGVEGGLDPFCGHYSPGDINGNGSINGVDIVYFIGYLKGGVNPPPYICACGGIPGFYPSADINGDCATNGIDIAYFVRYLKLQVPNLLSCPDCPPAGE